MKILTAMWGELEVADTDIYTFPKGIPGFDQESQFALIHEQDSPFIYMQSLKEQHLAFIVTDPFNFYPDYEFELPEEESEELDIQDTLMIRSIITLRDNIEDSSLNLLAPLIFNPERRVGKQIVLHRTSYQTSHRLWNSQTEGE